MTSLLLWSRQQRLARAWCFALNKNACSWYAVVSQALMPDIVERLQRMVLEDWPDLDVQVQGARYAHIQAHPWQYIST